MSATNQLSIMYADLADRVNVDSTVAANKTRLLRYINQTVQIISGRWPWKWLEQRTIIQTVVDETAGTVSVSAGGTAVTGVGTAFVAADVNSYIQFHGDTNWYGISARSSGLAITLDQAYGGTTNLSGVTYIVRRIFYSLPNTVDRIISIRQSTLPQKLVQLGETTMDLYDPAFQNLGAPLAYAIVKPDPSVAVSAQPQWQLSFEPIADAVYNLECRTVIIPTDLAADTDICIIPYKFINVVLDGAEWLYAKHQNDPDESRKLQVFEMGIAMMKENGNEDDDTLYVLQPNEIPSTNGFIPMPSNYEPPRT